MLFTLEALDADHGDSLLLHCGTAQDPLLVVIDGGPTHVYEKSLHKRLEELRAQRAPDGSLPIEMVMLSHIDDDHINGLLAMTRDLVELHDDQQPLPYDVFTLWHNSFDDITGNDSDDFRDIALEALAKPAPDGDAEKARTAGLAVVASVAQGRTLRDRASTLGWKHNDPFDNLVIAGTDAPLGDATKLTVVCPHPEQLKKLHESWEEFLEKKQAKEAGKVVGRVAAYDDNSVNNLSSIVVLVEAGGKRMLLCGDARGDHVLDGLKLAGLADADGVTKLDILKLPHHGSIRNVEADMFKRLPAKHYVISANGHDGNPETETLDMIVDANPGNDDFTIHLTNDAGKGKEGSDLNKRVTEFRERWKAAGRNFKIVVRDPGALGLSIHLGDEQP
jgi:beta-lactamase superfamily II metal-dependent hydrolase